MNKKLARIRRATKFRKQFSKLDKVIRLVVHRTSKHIYAQIISISDSKTLAAASTTEKSVYRKLKYTGNQEAAIIVGRLIAERALKQGIRRVIFDRSGFKYHGRVKALADSSRSSGLQF